MEIAYPPAIFSEVLDFMASSPTSQEILDYKPSMEMENRLRDLLTKNEKDALSPQEREELNAFMNLNHFMNMLKIRVREKLTQGEG